MKCPLCTSNKIKKLDSLDRNALISLYEKLTKVNFSYLIDQNIDYCECQKCKLRFYDPFIIGDEKFYNALQNFNWYYLDEKFEYEEAAKYIKLNDAVLDVGSGKGAFAKLLPTKNYIGLDTSEGAREMASKDGIKIERKSIQNYVKNHKESFDVVVSFQVLEHVDDPKSFLQAKIDALKVGGKLVIAVPSEDSFLKYVANGILNMPPHHTLRWSDEALQFIAEQYGLELLHLHHEKMRDIHTLWFVDTFLQNLFLQPRLIDVSLKRKIISCMSQIFAKILEKGAKEEFLPHGHTVIAIYQKK